ncbi:MAG TPA: hypothetical protein VIH88_04340 [Candidatus Acidoferrales bacterium]
MFLGHFGVALAAKKVAPRASLGVLVLAAQFADLLWPIFLLLGWEQVRIAPGITRVTPLDFISYPYSHSLVAQLLWGVALGAVYFAIRRDGRGAVVAGMCVATHWVLDFAAHRPDMPMVPGGERYGLGMWNSLPLTLFVEFAIYGAGIAIYLKTTRAKDRVGIYALWALLIFLFVIYVSGACGDAPPDVKAIAYITLTMWLLVPWAAWADKHRAVMNALAERSPVKTRIAEL